MPRREKEMFEGLFDFGMPLSGKQALGFYIVSLLVLIILFGMLWSFMGVTGMLAPDDFYRSLQVKGTGWFIGFIESVGLCSFVVHKKRLVNGFGILMVFAAFLLSFFSGLISLVVPAYVMTLKSGRDNVPFKSWFK